MEHELPTSLRPKWEHLTTAFLQSVIIHEHAHAILAEGVDQHRKASIADTDKDGWAAASGVNEALVEWAELRFFRHDVEMLDITWEHATSCNTPSGLTRAHWWLRRCTKSANGKTDAGSTLCVNSSPSCDGIPGRQRRS